MHITTQCVCNVLYKIIHYLNIYVYKSYITKRRPGEWLLFEECLVQHAGLGGFSILLQ